MSFTWNSRCKVNCKKSPWTTYTLHIRADRIQRITIDLKTTNSHIQMRNNFPNKQIRKPSSNTNHEVPNICMQERRCDQPPNLPFVNKSIDLYTQHIIKYQPTVSKDSMKPKQIWLQSSNLLLSRIDTNLTLAPQSNSVLCVASCAT